VPLVLEIEHLLGVAFAAQGPESETPDWPPQPDRVFSALVAAWAARGERPDERMALEWLEEQAPPEVAASPAAARPAPLSYVPPNDKNTDKAAAYPWRMRQPRRFPAALPLDPVVRMIWQEAEGAPVTALDALARDVAYVGHSASLTRCRFVDGEAPPQTVPARRRVYKGRLRELETAYSKDDPRRRRRPSPGEAVRPPPAVAEPGRNAFSPDWLVFEIAGDHTLDLRAAPLACKALIKAVMSGYGAEDGAPAPEWVCGHRTDGSPSPDPHLAAVPLAFAGFPHADGALFGFALVPPRGRGDLLRDRDFARALLALSKDDGAQHVVSLALGKDGALDLALTLEAERASLNPARYSRPSRRWASVTPLVLDRHVAPPRPELKGDGDRYRRETEDLVRRACANVGLPEPARVIAAKHSAVTGAPPAYPSGKAPDWSAWRTPAAFASRRLSHAILQFDEPQAGPVMIGAGRFCGFGLCLPLDREQDG
jgi:CRISPR-associated protein Csb2